MIVIHRRRTTRIHSEVQRTDAQLEKGSVIAPTSQIGKAVIFGAKAVEVVPCVVESSFAIDDFLHDLLGEGAEFRGGACSGEGTGDADVDVEVGYCCGGEPGVVFFDPFR